MKLNRGFLNRNCILEVDLYQKEHLHDNLTYLVIQRSVVATNHRYSSETDQTRPNKDNFVRDFPTAVTMVTSRAETVHAYWLCMEDVKAEYS